MRLLPLLQPRQSQLATAAAAPASAVAPCGWCSRLGCRTLRRLFRLLHLAAAAAAPALAVAPCGSCCCASLGCRALRLLQLRQPRLSLLRRPLQFRLSRLAAAATAPASAVAPSDGCRCASLSCRTLRLLQLLQPRLSYQLLPLRQPRLSRLATAAAAPALAVALATAAAALASAVAPSNGCRCASLGCRT